MWRPIEEQEKAQIRELVRAFRKDWQEDSKVRLERLLASDAQSDDPPDFALDGPLLVDDVDDPRWQRLDRSRLTTDEGAYDEALVPFLADLASSYRQIARGLASRMDFPHMAPSHRAARLARGVLDRAGPALPEDVRERLSRIASQLEMND